MRVRDAMIVGFLLGIGIAYIAFAPSAGNPESRQSAEGLIRLVIFVNFTLGFLFIATQERFVKGKWGGLLFGSSIGMQMGKLLFTGTF